MNRSKWLVYLGLAMVLLTVTVYLIHYLIFRDAHHIFIYLIGDIAFVFFEVFLVTIILDELLKLREKKALLEKLNMVIGTFFSEAGTELLKLLSRLDPEASKTGERLRISDNWAARDFDQLIGQFQRCNYKIEPGEEHISAIRDLLLDKRDFLLRLLENPSILEHDQFTKLLQAVFHLTEELAAREKISHLASADRGHLATDIGRVYTALTLAWIRYMKYLKTNYPYLFSFSVRTNPFNPEARPELT